MNSHVLFRTAAHGLMALLCALSLVAQAAERTEMEGATIRGDQEQPQVLFLLPWQPPPSPDISVPPPRTDLGDVLKPLERQRFREELYFRKNLELGELKED
ncbi:hypothetical protein [Allohahella marinimesophila]|uniref:Uncharacterized protein n=1 Tax=Allohahella marinimesophila TaxID=1054972 RepID=A0ABP7PEP9_9GAMM